MYWKFGGSAQMLNSGEKSHSGGAARTIDNFAGLTFEGENSATVASQHPEPDFRHQPADANKVVFPREMWP